MRAWVGKIAMVKDMGQRVSHLKLSTSKIGPVVHNNSELQ